MKRKFLRNSIIVVAVLAFLGVFYGLAYKNTPETDATVKATGFNAGRIIDDEVFYNANTMTVDEIQAHLDKYSASCDMWGEKAIGYGRSINGKAVDPTISRREYARLMREAGRSDYHDAPYVCISKYYENPTTHTTNYDTNGEAQEDMISAAQIIYDAAQKYSINPQVLLVMLKKESYVWGDTWPLKNEYNTVMGYGCPDNAACDAKYYGFYNQVMKAAWQLNYYKEHIYSYGYYPYMTNNIYYSPNTSCGTKAVYLENIATTSLYIYTPYTPNDAALANYPGEAYCGSYGNRNFFMYFNEWFGSGYYTFSATETIITEGTYRIVSAENTSNSLQVLDDALTVNTRQDNNNDLFNFARNSDGTYTLYNIATNKAIDVPESKAENGVSPIIFNYHGGNNQRWKLYINSDSTISIASALNKTLVISNNGNSQYLNIYSANSDSNDYYLVPVSNIETVETETLYRLQSKAISNKYIDIYGGITKNTTSGKINTFTKNNGESDNQTFLIKNIPNSDYYYLENEASGLRLTINGTGKLNIDTLAVSKSTMSCNQKWSLKESSGYITLFSACTGKVLDLNRGDGSITMYTYHGGDNQQWKLIESEKRPIADGNYAIKSSLNLSYSISSNGYLKSISLTNKTTPEIFRFKYDSYLGYYTIYTEDGYVLDVANSYTVNGSNIITFSSHSGCNQRWKISKNEDNTYSIAPFCINKNIDLWGSDLSYGKITIWEKHTGKNQRWNIENQ